MGIYLRLDRNIAKNFIEKLAKTVDEVIFLTDEKGKIYASSTGQYIDHILPFVKKHIEIDASTFELSHNIALPSLKNGMGYSLLNGGICVGSVIVSGRNALQVGKMVKLSLEAMMSCNECKNNVVYNKQEREQLLEHIISGDIIFNTTLETRCKRLNIDVHCMRIPILLTINTTIENLLAIKEFILRKDLLKMQDLFCMTKEQDLLIYKHVSTNFTTFMQNYQIEIGEDLHMLLMHLKKNNYEYKTHVGSLQENFAYYQMGYDHCIWLKEFGYNNNKSAYFYQNIDEYLMAKIPFYELEGIYNVFQNHLTAEQKNIIKEIIRSLIRNNYNVNQASQEMHVHKNTLTYRLNKLREALNVNPLLNNNERGFMSGMLNYIDKLEK